MTRVVLVVALLLCCSCKRPDPAAENPAPSAAASTAPSQARIVSLSPSTTEAVYAMGAGSQLVARSAQCDFPARAKGLPSVGGFASPDVERIVGLRPDWVVGSQSPAGPSLQTRLKGLNIRTFFPPTRSLAEIGTMIVKLGDHLGRGDRARQLRTEIQQRVQRIERWAKTKSPVKVVLVFDASPLFVAGPGGFSDELLQRAGAKNLVTRGGPYPNIDLEKLLALDPELIIDASDMGGKGASKLSSRPGWAGLGAVQSGQVRPLRSDSALRPGPRIADGLAELARLIHQQEPPR